VQQSRSARKCASWERWPPAFHPNRRRRPESSETTANLFTGLVTFVAPRTPVTNRERIGRSKSEQLMYGAVHSNKTFDGSLEKRNNDAKQELRTQLFFKARALKVNRQRTKLTNVHRRSRHWQREPWRRWHEDVRSQPGLFAQGHLQAAHWQYCAYTRHD
jgi:hypothetical protein